MNKKIGYISSFIWLTVIFLVFQLFYFNHFLPIQDGWFTEYAQQINSGKLIYKDFQVFLQPIYVFIVSWISDHFGYSLITLRYYGLLERALLIGVSYLLFSQITTAYRATFLTLFGIFIALTSTTDLAYSYYQLTAVFVFASTYCLILFYRHHSLAAVMVAGLFSGLAFMTKQSTGTLVPFALLIAMGFLSRTSLETSKKSLASILLFISGAIVPILLIVGYIWQLGIFDHYWKQVFVGASSKGKLEHVLFHFWRHLLSLKQFFVLIAFATVFYILNRIDKKKSETSVPHWINKTKLFWQILGIMLLSIATLTPIFIKYFRGFSILDRIYASTHFFSNVSVFVYICFYFNAAQVAYYFYRTVFKAITTNEIPIAIISVASFAFMYAHGLSGFIEPHSAIVSAGLFCNCLFNTRVPFNDFKNMLLYLFIIFSIGMCAFGKAAWMYSWWGWDEKMAWTANTEPNSSLLKGFRLNKDKADMIDGIVNTIQKYSHEGDSIYIFPHMPMFYLLANRPHSTFSAVHYFDVCSDALAKADAQIIAIKKTQGHRQYGIS